MFARLAPALFVLIWSTGFVTARWVVPHGAPQLILLVRLAITAAVMAAAAFTAREAWPRGAQLRRHLLAGALLNGIYLCVSWWAVQRGMPAGIMALLGALQPLLVAVGSFLFMGERLPARGWGGLAVALAGVFLVLAPLLEKGLQVSVPPIVVVGACTAILAMAAGTMVQSGKLAADGIRVSSAVQNLSGAVVALVICVMVGDYRWDNSPQLWFGLGWSVLMLSAAGLSLLVWMTRRQGPTRVSVLLLLVPPLAALESRFLFGEQLMTVQIIGFALALGGVLLARSGPKKD
ncbi:DMT family transporter [uncultured Novosphingobium sp.]|uniref:DMT family transporter n=1 Tax=uncultured Novosphingobium sp. TaxID=292277 RepID=UPI00258DC9ED|nr:DMT family transporter [uncultured Novosphingobium sp.]